MNPDALRFVDWSCCHPVVVYSVFEEIDYIIPTFDVLHVRMHRCRISVVSNDGEEGPQFNSFINSETIVGERWPQMIIPYSSCDIQVSCGFFRRGCVLINILMHRDLRSPTTSGLVLNPYIPTTKSQLFGDRRLQAYGLCKRRRGRQ